MANVSTEGMNAAAGSISGAAASAKAAIEGMKAEASKIIELCGRIEGFNGQYVSGHEPRTIIQYENYTMENGEIGQKEIRFRSYQKWRVSSPGGISAAASSIIGELESLEASLSDFGAAATEIEGRSDVIDGYMNTIMSQLGSNIDQSTLMGAFRAGGLLGALKLHIAYDAEQAANGKFIANDKILSEYWTDKPLSFVKQENGTYAIYQEDDNGNQVLMGYTTGATALGYMTSLGKASGVIPTSKVKSGAESKDEYLINKENDRRGAGANGKTGAQSKDDYLISTKEAQEVAKKHPIKTDNNRNIAEENGLSTEFPNRKNGKPPLTSNEQQAEPYKNPLAANGTNNSKSTYTGNPVLQQRREGWATTCGDMELNVQDMVDQKRDITVPDGNFVFELKNTEGKKVQHEAGTVFKYDSAHDMYYNASNENDIYSSSNMKDVNVLNPLRW